MGTGTRVATGTNWVQQLQGVQDVQRVKQVQEVRRCAKAKYLETSAAICRASLGGLYPPSKLVKFAIKATNRGSFSMSKFG